MAVSSISSGSVVPSTRIIGPDEPSAVQRLLDANAKKTAVPSDEDVYTEQEWYIRAKVFQLQSQIDFYSRIGGDIGNGAINSIETEISGMIKKLTDKASAKQAEADKLAEQLKEKERLKALELPTPDELIKRAADRVAGIEPKEELSDAVKKLLEDAKKKARGETVDTSA